MVGAGPAAATRRKMAGSRSRTAAIAPARRHVSRTLEHFTVLDYRDTIIVSQGMPTVYPGPPITLIVLRSIATLLSLRVTVARTSNSPAGISLTTNTNDRGESAPLSWNVLLR